MKPLFLLTLSSTLLPALLLGTLLTLPARAADVSADKLQTLKAHIKELSEAQSEDLKKRDSQRARLEQTEKRIGKLVSQRRDLERKVAAAKQHLQQVKAHQQQLAEHRHTQLDWLARTVRTVYESGQQPRIRLLLNQQEPDKVARLLAYQHYFQQARTQRLAVLDDQLADLREVARQVSAARADLQDRQAKLSAQETQLKAAATERQQVLASLEHSITTRGSHIDHLRDNEKRLEKLLAEVQRRTEAAGGAMPADMSTTPFGKLRGKLPWPVNGKMLESFHSQREGALRWDGVVLAASVGTPVRAIHAGRVVFANWMRGYGLLIIVDHGNGYLSLYGYNQSLLRDVGEWVATGDELALAGRSGGNAHSGLYFEIRHHGKVIDPAHWCSRHVTLPPLARNDN